MRVIEGENELRLTCSRSASGGIALLRCETQDDIVRLPDEIDGVPVTAPGADRGFMFQEHTLFPWLSIYDNIAFGLRARGIYKQEKDRVDEFIEMVGLKGFEHSYPHQLSGGMLQRIMIGIAMALQPELLIADEPTTAIDAITQYEILEEFIRIKKQKNTAMLFITHDLGAISKVADRILVMNSGHVVDSGSFDHILKHADDPYTRMLVEKRSAVMHRYRQILHGKESSNA